MYFEKHKTMISPPNHFGPETFRDQGFFSVLSHSKTGQGITMAETLIIILAEHNVPINFADHFTKLLSNKLVFPDSVFLRVRGARAPCSLKVVTRVVTNFFFQKLNRSDHMGKIFII